MTRLPSVPALVLVAFIALLVAACGSASVSAPAASEASEAPATPAESLATEPSEAPEPSEPNRPSEAPEAPSEAPSSAEAAPGELDWQLAPNYGSTELAAGFTPDPFSQILTSGGPIDVSYLGGECRGWATAAPDFDVNYESGSMTLLRFYFVADTAVDTTIIVNAPDGEWYCNDDAPGTIDPMLDFANPEPGLYDIWVGSYDEGDPVEGTLYVTELSSNAP
jgi:hypothetical protein